MAPKYSIVGLRDRSCLSGDCADKLADDVGHVGGEVRYGSHASVLVTVPLDPTNGRGSVH